MRNRPAARTFGPRRADLCAVPRLPVSSCTSCLRFSEVPPAAELIHPRPGRHRLEKVQGSAVGNPQRRSRVFRGFAASAAAGERQVYIIGWDIHSLTRLVGPSGRADDGYPEELGAFLKAPLTAKPELRINILSWDFPALYAAEREWNSAAKFTVGSAGPASLLFRFQSSFGLRATPEDRRHRRRDRLFGRSRPYDQALGHQRASQPTIRCAAIPTASPIRRFTTCNAWSRAKPPARRRNWRRARWAAAGCTVRRPRTRQGRSLAGIGAGASAGHDRPASRGPSSRTAGQAGLTKSRGCSRHRSTRQTDSSISRTSSPAPSRSRDCWRGGWLDVPSLRVLIVTPKAHSSWFESQAMQSGRGGFHRASSWRPASPTGCAFSIRRRVTGSDRRRSWFTARS